MLSPVGRRRARERKRGLWERTTEGPRGERSSTPRREKTPVQPKPWVNSTFAHDPETATGPGHVQGAVTADIDTQKKPQVFLTSTEPSLTSEREPWSVTPALWVCRATKVLLNLRA